MSQSHKETLEWLYEVTRASIEDADAKDRSPLIGRLQAISKELEELNDNPSTDSGEVTPANGLIDFQTQLAKRKSAPKAARKASG